jgi:hypothetical protein
MGLKSAARYAKMYQDGIILRVIVPECIRLEQDPQGYAIDEMRTCENIPSYFVLPTSKNELDLEQIKRINFSLNIDLNDEDSSRLCRAIYKKIIKKSKKDDQLIVQSLDFKSEQQTIIFYLWKPFGKIIDLLFKIPFNSVFAKVLEHFLSF